MQTKSFFYWKVFRNCRVAPIHLCSKLLEGENPLKSSLTHAHSQMKLLLFQHFWLFSSSFTWLHLAQMCLKNLLDLSVGNSLLEGLFHWFLILSALLETFSHLYKLNACYQNFSIDHFSLIIWKSWSSRIILNVHMCANEMRLWFYKMIASSHLCQLQRSQVNFLPLSAWFSIPHSLIFR